MNIRHLEIFLAVCEHMSISRAAKSLYMSQPAVSIAIKELEEFYHCRLFDRISRKIYLTPSGEKLYSYAHVILGQIEESITSLANDTLLQHCHIGINVTIGESYLCDMLDNLKEKYPFIKPHMTIKNMRVIEQDLILNKYDFVLTDHFVSSSNIALEKLYSEKMLAVASYDYVKEDEISIYDLCHYTLLKRENGSGIRQCIDRVIEDKGVKEEDVIESASNQTLIELAKRGYGIAFMPESLVREDIGMGMLKAIDIKELTIHRDYYLAYYKNKYLSDAIKTYMNEIIHYFHDVYDIANKK